MCGKNFAPTGYLGLKSFAAGLLSISNTTRKLSTYRVRRIMLPISGYSAKLRLSGRWLKLSYAKIKPPEPDINLQRMKKTLTILTALASLTVIALADDAYDKGLLAGKRSIAWADEVGLLTKQELTERAETQADYALRDDLITAADYDEFVAGWMEGALSLYPDTFSALIAGLNDADLKRLLIGTWTAEPTPAFMEEPPVETLTFTCDGRWLPGYPEERWDIDADLGSVRDEFTGCPSRKQFAKILEDEKRYNAAARRWLKEAPAQ